MSPVRISAIGLASLAVSVGCTDPPATAPEYETAVARATRALVSPAATVTVVMSGLDAPKGLAWGPEGGLYVVESGTRQITGPCTAVARGLTCLSGTGAVTRWWKGQQERIASGLPSVFNPVTQDIGGGGDIAFQGRGNAFITVGWGADPATRAGLGVAGHDFGQLIRMTPNGAWTVAAEVSDFEQANNPAGGPVDSNPFGVLAEPGRQFVTDAGGNSLLQIVQGVVSLVAVFPSTLAPPPFGQSEAVPTEVVRGPDGALYVSTLSGVPFAPGAARIYRVVPGASPTVYATGFTQVTDFDIGADGSLYVLQYASAPFFGGPGSVVRVAPDGTRTTVISGLVNPTGILAGEDGAIYVSNRGNVPAVGEVLRIMP